MKGAVLLIGNFLSCSGATVTVGEELAGRLAGQGWRALRTSSRRGRVERLVDMMVTVFRRSGEFRAAIVDVYSGPAFLWAEAVCCALRLAGKPYALTLHGGNLPAFARRSRRRVRSLLQSARAVVVPSRYLYDEMSLYRKDLILLPNAVDLGSCRFRLRAHPRPRLIWVRALHPIYNPALAVKIVARLAKEFPEIHLTILGPEGEAGCTAAVKQLAAKLSVAERLEMAGGVPKWEVPRWLDMADVFLNTSNFDNMPVSLLEGLACGLCVVSSNVGGIPHILKDGENGLLVPPNDAEAFCIAVRRILADRGLAESLSVNARRTAEEVGWERILPRWESLIRSLE